jgi:AcrR family transcriptional regulator
VVVTPAYTAPVPATQAESSTRTNGRDRTNARGDATRELILVTAERLFAERGIAAVPLRDIGAAAGQKNNVAVQYHFGDRDTLVRSIVSYRSAFIDDLAADVARAGESGGAAVSEVVSGFVRAFAANITAGNHFLPFLSRYITEHGGYGGLEEALPRASVLTLRDNLYRVMADRPEALLEERWEVLATCTIHTLARYQLARSSGALPAPLDQLLDDLVRILTAGLEAPVVLPVAAGRYS